MPTIYGYIRVLNQDQTETSPLVALSEYPISTKNIYMDQQSEQDDSQTAYQELLYRLEPGDQLVITSISHLGRTYEEMVTQWHFLTKEKEIRILVIDMPLLDTSHPCDLIEKFLTDLVFQLLSYLAQIERDSNRQRQAEGIAAAKQRGVQFGRPKLPIPPTYFQVSQRWRAGEISSRAAAQELNVSQGTFLRWERKNKGET